MNTIRTVADLRKALSAYPQDMKIVVLVNREPVTLNNDHQICQNVNNNTVEISLTKELS